MTLVLLNSARRSLCGEEKLRKTKEKKRQFVFAILPRNSPSYPQNLLDLAHARAQSSSKSYKCVVYNLWLINN